MSADAVRFLERWLTSLGRGGTIHLTAASAQFGAEAREISTPSDEGEQR